MDFYTKAKEKMQEMESIGIDLKEYKDGKSRLGYTINVNGTPIKQRLIDKYLKGEL